MDTEDLESDSPTHDYSFFQCPGCGGDLQPAPESVRCTACGHSFPMTDGIPELYWANDWDEDKSDVTQDVREFYEDAPFPNYDDLESVDSLARKAGEGLFARLLDEQVPPGARVIECGCGTGQLSIYLSIHNREVVGADLCMNSLRLGQEFAQTHDLDRVRFTQMNLFRPPFQSESFHLVISNGVLHHTSDPKGGFQSISRLVKPGGFILIGLYHYWGRLITDTRRQIFKYSGDRFKSLDPNLKNPNLSEAKKRAWFLDQYKHPHESKHTIRETIGWLDESGFDFVRSIPSTHLGSPIAPDEKLFVKEPAASWPEALLTEMLMTAKGSREGGFFIVIAQKRK